jgi:hypothetical protein
MLVIEMKVDTSQVYEISYPLRITEEDVFLYVP